MYATPPSPETANLKWTNKRKRMSFIHKAQYGSTYRSVEVSTYFLTFIYTSYLRYPNLYVKRTPRMH